MRLIFLNRFFHPDHSATSQMLSDLAFGLAQRRHRVTVITSRLRYDAPDELLPARETAGDVDIIRVWTSRFGRGHLALRALDYLTFYVSAAFALWLQARRGDIVIAKTDPPMLSVVVAPIARLRGAKLVNWLQDIFPEVAQALGVGGGRSGLGYRVLRGLRNQSLRRAAMNVAIGDRMAERLMGLQVDPARIRCIPNWASCDAIKPVEPNHNRLREHWGLTGKFVAGYSGNLGRAHEIETLLGAIQRVEGRADLAMVRWLFIGGGALFETMRHEAQERRLTSVSFRPYQPREQLAESLSAADVHLVSLRPELEGLIVPSKFYGVAAAGRPTLFIGDADGEIARLVARYACGLTVAAGDSEALAARVAALAQEPNLARDMGRRARIMCEAHFDTSQAVTTWEELFKVL